MEEWGDEFACIVCDVSLAGSDMDAGRGGNVYEYMMPAVGRKIRTFWGLGRILYFQKESRDGQHIR